MAKQISFRCKWNQSRLFAHDAEAKIDPCLRLLKRYSRLIKYINSIHKFVEHKFVSWNPPQPLEPFFKVKESTRKNIEIKPLLGGIIHNFTTEQTQIYYHKVHWHTLNTGTHESDREQGRTELSVPPPYNNGVWIPAPSARVQLWEVRTMKSEIKIIKKWTICYQRKRNIRNLDYKTNIWYTFSLNHNSTWILCKSKMFKKIKIKLFYSAYSTEVKNILWIIC